MKKKLNGLEIMEGIKNMRQRQKSLENFDISFLQKIRKDIILNDWINLINDQDKEDLIDDI